MDSTDWIILTSYTRFNMPENRKLNAYNQDHSEGWPQRPLGFGLKSRHVNFLALDKFCNLFLGTSCIAVLFF